MKTSSKTETKENAMNEQDQKKTISAAEWAEQQKEAFRQSDDQPQLPRKPGEPAAPGPEKEYTAGCWTACEIRDGGPEWGGLIYNPTDLCFAPTGGTSGEYRRYADELLQLVEAVGREGENWTDGGTCPYTPITVGDWTWKNGMALFRRGHETPIAVGVSLDGLRQMAADMVELAGVVQVAGH
jgi:hypothetical protein